MNQETGVAATLRFRHYAIRLEFLELVPIIPSISLGIYVTIVAIYFFFCQYALIK